jgi:hypothetical protein
MPATTGLREEAHVHEESAGYGNAAAGGAFTMVDGVVRLLFGT